MLTKISLTFGSRQILQSIIDKYPERHFKLMQTTTHTRKLALFDLSGKDTIFKSPVELSVLDETLDANLNGLFYYQSFQVNGDRQKLLYNSLQKVIEDPSDMNGGYLLSVDNKVEATTLVLLTSWKDFESLTNWQNSESFKSLKNFTSMGSDNSYYDEIYKSVF
ncbi:hypothetical protein H5S09_01565 [Limosilactobacillus sp. STM2_1]|uniref:ABM domain-containing protein n=1 Tax=Limosilactobacillus rudii TaxID=2759755 RepID=A0A7W3UJH7_9LACO|nr:hypothetical protein [Limosilactobacillus rudii]MBB1078525.1 hypothetical protein [Limosilactobacillus rudii]MBB1096654.1 hypothetical protein [Limosilactobacillus rudii]MCD7133687.1 antibiotic biosynthesis monooxygenase [Limosilactobacillus rudii]